MPAQANDNSRTAPDQDRDVNRGELTRFDKFLDNHREIAEQVRKDPSLLDNRQFVKNHPALANYLKENAGIRQQIRNDAASFMAREERYDSREDVVTGNEQTRQEMLRFDRFLDNHRDTERQLRRNPSLVNDQQFLKDHPALQVYLQEHPAVREQIQQNPSAFVERNYRNDQGQTVVTREDRDRDVNHDSDANRLDRDRSDRDRDDMDRNDRTRQDADRFNHFLDRHRESAEQLRRNPSLVNDQQFLKDHPALQSYLQDHPEVRQEISNSPSAFLQAQTQARYGYEHGVDATSRQEAMVRNNHDSRYASFGQFLNMHNNVAQEIFRDPSLVNNQEYLQNHPELQTYLNAHPEVRGELMANPHSFVRQSQQYNSNNGQPAKSPTLTSDPTKPKQ